MKRNSLIPLLGTIFLLVAELLHAQEQQPDKRTQVGIGITIGKEFTVSGEDGSFIFLPVGFTNIYVPILIRSKFRIEPELGWFRSSQSGDITEYSFTSFRYGLGIFSATQKQKMHLYYGLRLGINRTSISYKSAEFFLSNEGTSKTDFFIGPSLGGEYFFSDHFTLGGEAQLNYISIGQFDGDRSPSNEVSESAWATRTLLFLRWYF
jgi:hypothetical protein